MTLALLQLLLWDQWRPYCIAKCWRIFAVLCFSSERRLPKCLEEWWQGQQWILWHLKSMVALYRSNPRWGMEVFGRSTTNYRHRLNHSWLLCYLPPCRGLILSKGVFSSWAFLFLFCLSMFSKNFSTEAVFSLPLLFPYDDFAFLWLQIRHFFLFVVQ